MKQLFFILLASLFALSSCDRDLDIYEGNSGIYFSTKDISLDTIIVSWGTKPGEVKTQGLKLRVMLFGDVVDYDRKFTIDVKTDANDTLSAEEGVDFEAISREYAIPANQAYTDINITLIRREGLKEHARRFTVALNETSELKFLYSRQGLKDSVSMRDLDYQRVIEMDEVFEMPRWWYGNDEAEWVFGKWSQTKSALICDVMGIDREEWVNAVWGDGKFTVGYMNYVGKYMHRWLQEHPTEDEDGKPMEMGLLSQF